MGIQQTEITPGTHTAQLRFKTFKFTVTQTIIGRIQLVQVVQYHIALADTYIKVFPFAQPVALIDIIILMTVIHFPQTSIVPPSATSGSNQLVCGKFLVLMAYPDTAIHVLKGTEDGVDNILFRVIIVLGHHLVIHRFRQIRTRR